MSNPGDADIVGCHIVVFGRVQGVFYRDSCRQVADRIGLRGWVRNNADGTVEAVIEGARGDIDDFVDWCREGPPQADVTDVRVTDQPATGEGPFRVVG